MIKLSWHKDAWEDYMYWSKTNKSIFNKINAVIKDTLRNPFSGIGKPEPLVGNYAGFWSKRINKEHRLLYRYTDGELLIIACRYHY